MEDSKPELLVNDVAEALRPILDKGLPISPDYADERLLSLSCVVGCCDDPSSRLNRVKCADELLRKAVAQYPDDRLNHAVSILFGVALGSRRLGLGDRRTRAAGDSGYDVDHFRKNIEPKILNELAWIIVRQTLQTSAPFSPAGSLSPGARRTARQVYRYAQQALVRVEAYGFCNTFAFTLWLGFHNARSQGVDPKPMPHGWLAEYCTGGERFHFTSSSRSPDSDLALWALAYCHRYLRVLLQDGTGHDYLRDNLSAGCWRRIQVGIAFQPEEIERTLSVLAEAPVDDACTFVDSLCQDSQGRSIHEEWLRTLCSQKFRQDNPDKRYANWDLTDGYWHSDAVGFDLLNLCILLQHAFPKDTLVWRGDESLIVILELIRRGLREIGLPDGHDSFRKVSDLGYDLASRRPPRYPWGEAGQVLWSDELPDPKLWTIPGEG